jgi:hypothetical protein
MSNWRRKGWTAIERVLLLAVLAACAAERTPSQPPAKLVHPLKSKGADAGPQRGSDAGRDAAADARSAPDSGIPIFDFVASQAYHDFPSLAGSERAHKFEAFITDKIQPQQVASLRVAGPDGFVFEFQNVPFADSLNGYVHNDQVSALWYQAIALGFLKDGRYTLELTLTDGGHFEYSRELVSNTALLDFYLAHRSAMRYSPDSGNSPADDTVLHWTTFHDLGGPDAYYNVWISSGTAEFVATDSARGDMIFSDAEKDPKAGLNNGSSRQGSAKDPLPLGPQTWQPEIVDANVLEQVNIIIFPPGQHFVAN